MKIEPREFVCDICRLKVMGSYVWDVRPSIGGNPWIVYPPDWMVFETARTSGLCCSPECASIYDDAEQAQNALEMSDQETRERREWRRKNP
jgi:hypothetical protein